METSRGTFNSQTCSKSNSIFLISQDVEGKLKAREHAEGEQREALEKQLEDAKAVIERVIKERDDKLASMEKDGQRVDDQSKEMEQLQRNISQMGDELNEKDDTIQSLQDAQHNLQEQFEEADAQVKTLKKELETLKEAKDKDTDARVKDLTDEVKAKEEEVRVLREAAAHGQKDSEEMERLRKELDEAQQEAKEKAGQHQKLTETMQGWKKKYEAKKEALTEQEDLMQKKDAEIKHLEKRIETEAAASEEALDDLQKRLSQAKKKHEQEMKDVAAEKERLEKELQQLRIAKDSPPKAEVTATAAPVSQEQPGKGAEAEKGLRERLTRKKRMVKNLKAKKGNDGDGGDVQELSKVVEERDQHKREVALLRQKLELKLEAEEKADGESRPASSKGEEECKKALEEMRVKLHNCQIAISREERANEALQKELAETRLKLTLLKGKEKAPTSNGDYEKAGEGGKDEGEGEGEEDASGLRRRRGRRHQGEMSLLEEFKEVLAYRRGINHLVDANRERRSGLWLWFFPERSDDVGILWWSLVVLVLTLLIFVIWLLPRESHLYPPS